MLIFQVVALNNQGPAAVASNNYSWIGAVAVIVILFFLVLAVLKLRPRDDEQFIQAVRGYLELPATLFIE